MLLERSIGMNQGLPTVAFYTKIRLTLRMTFPEWNLNRLNTLIGHINTGFGGVREHGKDFLNQNHTIHEQ